MLIPVAVGLSALVWALLVLLSGVQTSGVWLPSAAQLSLLVVPRSVVILYPILGSAFVWGTRQVASLMLRSVGIEIPVRVRERAHNVLIYGAGTTGVQLLEELRRAGTYEPIGFIDMNPTLWGMYVAGLKVYRPERLADHRAAQGRARGAAGDAHGQTAGAAGRAAAARAADGRACAHCRRSRTWRQAA